MISPPKHLCVFLFFSHACHCFVPFSMVEIYILHNSFSIFFALTNAHICSLSVSSRFVYLSVCLSRSFCFFVCPSLYDFVYFFTVLPCVPVSVCFSGGAFLSLQLPVYLSIKYLFLSFSFLHPPSVCISPSVHLSVFMSFFLSLSLFSY